MNLEDVVLLALKHQFKPHGQLRPRTRNGQNGSSYQAFRKGNRYIWIGLAYLESQHDPIALSYKSATVAEVESFIREAADVV